MVKLEKWNPATRNSTRLLTPSDAASGDAQTNNTTKANPCLTADLLGDWREEILLRDRSSQHLLLYTTTDLTTTRLFTLMHDSQYRQAVAHENSAYNQPPHPSFFLGTGMSTPSPPNIVLADSANNVTATLPRTAAPTVFVYPNPASGSIQLHTAQACTYQIYDTAGQLVEQGRAQGDHATGQHLAAGLYLVRVQTADGRWSNAKVQKE